jgi:hypothetical protein
MHFPLLACVLRVQTASLYAVLTLYLTFLAKWVYAYILVHPVDMLSRFVSLRTAAVTNQRVMKENCRLSGRLSLLLATLVAVGCHSTKDGCWKEPNTFNLWVPKSHHSGVSLLHLLTSRQVQDDPFVEVILLSTAIKPNTAYDCSVFGISWNRLSLEQAPGQLNKQPVRVTINWSLKQQEGPRKFRQVPGTTGWYLGPWNNRLLPWSLEPVDTSVPGTTGW